MMKQEEDPESLETELIPPPDATTKFEHEDMLTHDNIVVLLGILITVLLTTVFSLFMISVTSLKKTKPIRDIQLIAFGFSICLILFVVILMFIQSGKEINRDLHNKYVASVRGSLLCRRIAACIAICFLLMLAYILFVVLGLSWEEETD